MLWTLLLVATFSGCQQPASQLNNVGGATGAASPFTSTRLGEGDTVRVAFEGDTNMNTVVKVQLDGTIALPMIGAYKVLGQTPEELRTALMERYKKILSVNEITVTLLQAQASVYVSGAVLKPGRIPLDRPLTALEAVMEAGGFDHRRAKAGTVSVIRKESGQQRRFTLDLKRALSEGDTNPFYVQPFDIIHVPEKSFNF
jgi:polysaccharide export outer membrane protein